MLNGNIIKQIYSQILWRLWRLWRWICLNYSKCVIMKRWLFTLWVKSRGGKLVYLLTWPPNDIFVTFVVVFLYIRDIRLRGHRRLSIIILVVHLAPHYLKKLHQINFNAKPSLPIIIILWDQWVPNFMICILKLIFITKHFGRQVRTKLAVP